MQIFLFQFVDAIDVRFPQVFLKILSLKKFDPKVKTCMAIAKMKQTTTREIELRQLAKATTTTNRKKTVS